MHRYWQAVNPGHTAAFVAVGLVAGVLSARGAGAAPATDAGAPATTPAPVVVRVVGHSVERRPIRARVIGSPDAARSVLVVGCIHGTERAGEAVTHALRRAAPPAGTSWWVVDRFNPDGCRPERQTRGNAHGVDLNRNAPWNWRVLDPPGGTYYAGPKALSEPESRAINRLIRTLRPAVTVWFHQHAALVDTSTGHRPIERRYAHAVGLPAKDYGTVPGSISTWQAHRFPDDTAFVVELPGPMPAGAVKRHVRAIGAL